jgi:hypothetical protein
MDQHLINFLGFDPAALKKQLAAGKGDGEILAWLMKNSKCQRTASEIAAWSAYQDHRAPCDVEGREFFQGAHQALSAKREDIVTWFDLLDLDDHVSFGGIA